MDEDHRDPDLINEEWLTTKRLEKFSLEYRKCPVLWLPSHNKFNVLSARRGAYVRLAKAMGVRSGNGVASRAARLCRLFIARLKHELLRAVEEMARRHAGSEGEGGPSSALELVPPWARRADRYLQLLGNVQKVPESQTRRIVRGMRRAARRTDAPDRAAAALLADKLHMSDDIVYELWASMRAVSLQAVRALVSRGDSVGPVARQTSSAARVPLGAAPAPRLTATHWAVADVMFLYGTTIIDDEHYKEYETLRALVTTFQLVQRCGLEPPPPRPSAAWRRAARLYSVDGVAMSALGLQRRWFELRLGARRSLRAAWRCAKRGEVARAPLVVLPIHRAIARRYPHVVTGDFTPWSKLRREGKLAKPTSERGPAPGEEGEGEGEGEAEGEGGGDERAACRSDDSNVESDDDIILVEDEIETIELDEDEKDATTNKGTNLTDMPDVNDPLDDAENSNDHDKGDSEENGATTKEVNEENEENSDVSKEIDETIGLNDNSNECEKKIDNTTELNKEVEKTAGVSESSDKPDEVIKEIDATIDANIEANTSNEVSETIDKAVNVSNKTIDFVEESKDSEEQDRDVLEALQELDVSAVQTTILFESDEEETDLRFDDHSNNADDHGQRDGEETETASEKEASLLQDVANYTFNNDEEVSKARVEKKECDGDLKNIENKDCSNIEESGNDESVVNKADASLNNESKSCTDTDVKSDKVVDDSESHTSIGKVRYHDSESSDSDNENLVIDHDFGVNDTMNDDNSKSTDNETIDEEIKNELLTIANETTSKDSFSSANSEEVDNPMSTKTTSEQMPVTQMPSSKPNDSKNTGTTDKTEHRYPLLSDMLSSASDDVQRAKKFKEIKRRMKAQKALEAKREEARKKAQKALEAKKEEARKKAQKALEAKKEEARKKAQKALEAKREEARKKAQKALEAKREEARKKAKAEVAVKDIIRQTKIDQFAKDLIDELVDQSVADGSTDEEEVAFDPKLLMFPVVKLTRLEDTKPVPTLLVPRKPRITSFDPTLTPKFVFDKRNISLLRVCKACSVVVERMDLRGWEVAGKGGGGGRVAKRVELPNIDDVRRNNRRIATAQVAPIREQRATGLGAAGAARGGAEAEGWRLRRPAPSEDDLARLLDDLAEPSPGHDADADSDGDAHICCSANLDSAGNTSEFSGEMISHRVMRSVMKRGCARCVERVLCAPPACETVAEMQRVLVRRWAGQARSSQVEQEKVRKKSERKEPPPAPVPARARSRSRSRSRARSPYDASRALKEWVREKNFVSEKFGIKPRSYKKPAPPPAAPPAALTPVPPLAPLAPLAAHKAPTSDTKTIVTLNKSREVSAAPVVLNAQSRPYAPEPARPGTGAGPAVDPGRAAGSRPDGANSDPAGTSISGRAGFPDNPGPSAGLFMDLDATHPFHGPDLLQERPGFWTGPSAGSTNEFAGPSMTICQDAGSIPPLQYVIRQNNPEESSHQKQPNIFNPNAVADINKKLNHLASNDTQSYAYMDAESSMENSFFPIITNVQSLAKNSPHLKKTPSQKLSSVKTVQKHSLLIHSNQRQNTMFLTQNKSQACPPQTYGEANSLLQSKLLNYIQKKNILSEQQKQGVLNIGNFDLSQQANQTQVGKQHTGLKPQPHLTIDASDPHLKPSQGRLLNAELPQAQPNIQTSLTHKATNQPTYVISGSYLSTQSGFVLQSSQQAQNPSQMDQLMSTMRESQPMPLNSVQAGLYANTQMSALQASSQDAQFSIVMKQQTFQATQAATRQGNELQVSSVQGGPPQAVSHVQFNPQSVIQVNPQALQVNPQALQVNPLVTPRLGMLLTNQQVTSLQGSVQVSSQANQFVTWQEVSQTNQMNQPLQAGGHVRPLQGGSQASAAPANASPVNASPVNASQINASQATPVQAPSGPVQDVYGKTESMIVLPAVRAEEYCQGRDPTTLTVAALGSSVWRLAGHLLLSEAATAVSTFYALQPLRRLILPDEEEANRKPTWSATAPSPPKMRKPNDPVAPTDATDNPPKKPPWLKVKSFAKMADSGTQERTQDAPYPQETRNPQEAPKPQETNDPVVVKAPACVHLENKVYRKLCDKPLTYAKVLSGVNGAAACRDLLVRRVPVYMYNPYAGTLTQVQGEPTPEATIVLTATKDTIAVIHELAKVLSPFSPQLAEPQPSKQAVNANRMFFSRTEQNNAEQSSSTKSKSNNTKQSSATKYNSNNTKQSSSTKSKSNNTKQSSPNSKSKIKLMRYMTIQPKVVNGVEFAVGSAVVDKGQAQGQAQGQGQGQAQGQVQAEGQHDSGARTVAPLVISIDISDEE